MKPKLVSISEEIVRWSFEISVNQSHDWFIAFTNPTAGPWKRITAPNSLGKFGEIHRFEIDETRPDLIIVNDKTQHVLIIEAKTSFADLRKHTQMIKTTQLFDQLSVTLRSIKQNEYWNSRSGYEYSLGLLWSSGDETHDQVFETCKDYLANVSMLTNDIICIQGFVADGLLKSKVYKALSGEILNIPS